MTENTEPMRPRGNAHSRRIKLVDGHRYWLSGHRRGTKGRTLRSWRTAR